jgi:NAD(P)-dependent dehydrogenase (short-subunit alcohol dehydrogenase family)
MIASRPKISGEPGSRMLEGQTALVTGASSGLGRRFAQVLAAAGANLIVTARRREPLLTLVDEIAAAGGRAVAVPLDMARPKEIGPGIDAGERAFGPVTILVNNAGMVDTGPAIDLDPADMDRMMAVNFRGPFLMASEVARRLIAAERSGRIVNIASITAYTYDGRTPCAFYAALKAGVVRMTETLSVEWAKHGINVNAIAPGFIRTEMNEAIVRERGAEIAQRKSRGRIGETHHLDSTLLYLVAPESEFVTGTCIRADDGQSR